MYARKPAIPLNNQRLLDGGSSPLGLFYRLAVLLASSDEVMEYMVPETTQWNGRCQLNVSMLIWIFPLKLALNYSLYLTLKF
jgi:hypothetical protein